MRRFLMGLIAPFLIALPVALSGCGYNTFQTTDEQIKEVSSMDDCIVVTKDKDFYYSHVLFRSPRKLLLVRCGNLRLRALLSLFERHLSEIEEALERSDLVELFMDEVRES